MTTPRPEQPAPLDILWDELLLDACASDGPIRDDDVRQAIKRYRGRIEAAAAALPDDFGTQYAAGEDSRRTERMLGFKAAAPLSVAELAAALKAVLPSVIGPMDDIAAAILSEIERGRSVTPGFHDVMQDAVDALAEAGE